MSAFFLEVVDGNFLSFFLYFFFFMIIKSELVLFFYSDGFLGWLGQGGLLCNFHIAIFRDKRATLEDHAYRTTMEFFNFVIFLVNILGRTYQSISYTPFMF